MELTDIPGIGDKTAATLAKAGIETLTQLLETYPRTYRHYLASTSKEARVGDWIVLKGHLTRPISRHTGRTTTQLSSFTDHSGKLTLRWFNLPYITRSVREQAVYLVSGKLDSFRGVKQIVSPQLRIIDDDTPLTDQLVPIYSQIGSLKPWILRTKIAAVLDHKLTPSDPLPDEIVNKYSLLSYAQALQLIHQPTTNQDLEPAIHRLAFQELYQLQLSALKLKRQKTTLTTPVTPQPQPVQDFLASLPFQPTNSQVQAINQILSDLAAPQPMHRLLQGEVGSGKTVVAAAATLAAHTAGTRTLVMAPTLILAEQLYDTLSQYLEPLGLSLSLITSKSKAGLNADVLIGTHALLSQRISAVGLVVIDEQHRFGVKQRESLAAISQHTLLMSATPIPRSLAQTLFGHLDVTHLTDLPSGRLVTKTFVVPEHKRSDSYLWIKQQVKQGNQVFYVVPLIEEAAEQDTTPLKSLQELERQLKATFPQLTVDIMHGKMNDKDKSAHMQEFRSGHTNILVATSMIEVGIDIPSANIMVIEDAERFGLATLHQLRGRVGRGGEQGYCLLFTKATSTKAQERLKYFVRTNEGDKLALFDLKSRGPGELFGQVQHGFFNLKMGNIYDEELLELTHQAAKLSLAKSVRSS